MANTHLLSVLIWLPVIGGALILALGSARAQAARWASMAVAVATFLWSLRLLTGFDYSNPGMQFVEQHAWIPSYGIHYNLGVDGIAVALILLARALKLAIFAALVAGVFVPLTGASGAAATLLLLAGVTVVAVLVGVVESAMARLRLSRVPQLLVGSGALALFAAILLLR